MPPSRGSDSYAAGPCAPVRDLDAVAALPDPSSDLAGDVEAPAGLPSVAAVANCPRSVLPSHLAD